MPYRPVHTEYLPCPNIPNSDIKQMYNLWWDWQSALSRYQDVYGGARGTGLRVENTTRDLITVAPDPARAMTSYQDISNTRKALDSLRQLVEEFKQLGFEIEQQYRALQIMARKSTEYYYRQSAERGLITFSQ